MLHMRHSMMWWCFSLLGVALILVAVGVAAPAALFVIPCALMMGAMMWMMMRGMGGASHEGRSESARDSAPPSTDAVEILERRFAEGQISSDEYRVRREILVGGPPESNGDGDRVDRVLAAPRSGRRES